MNAKSLRALFVLNVALLVGLLVTVVTPPPAEAQLTREEFIMVAGKVAGRSSQDVIYVINLGTSEIAAMFFQTANNEIEPIDRRPLFN